MSRAEETPSPRCSRLAIASLVLGLLSLVVGVLTGIPALLTGMFALLAVRRHPGRLSGTGFAFAGMTLGVVGSLVGVLIAYLVGTAIQEAVGHSASRTRFQEFANPLAKWAGSPEGVPPAAVSDPLGRPGLSWRVLLLPFLGPEGEALVHRFQFDRPWRDPNNERLLRFRPDAYAPSRPHGSQPYGTRARLFVGPGLPFTGEPLPGKPLADRPAGLAHTLLVAESADLIPWTAPQELKYDPDGPLPALGDGRGFLGVMADGSVRWVPAGVSEAVLRAAITGAAGADLPD